MSIGMACSTMVSRNVACPAILAALLLNIGCSDYGELERPLNSDTSAKTMEQGTEAPGEPTFAHQLAAVREGTADSIVLERTTVTAYDLAQLEGVISLRWLMLDDVPVSDEALAPLAALTNLERLKLGRCRVGDRGIEHIAALKNLRLLNLPDAEFSDEALARIAELPQLELLRFGSPHVTDAGMAHVARMPSLRWLHVIDVPITDASLEHIKGMKKLESFYVDGSNLTDDGMSDLVKSRPDLHFHKDQQHLDRDPRRHDHEH